MLHLLPDPALPPLPNGPAPALTWQRLAPGPEGRRAPDTPLVDARDPARAPLLDHAGPAAVAHLTTRPLGAADAPCPGTDRRALPLDDAGWDALLQTLTDAARGLPRVGLAVCEDNLLFSALSPVANPGPDLNARLARVRPVVHALARAAGELVVFLTVDEGCPRGLDLTEGRAVARALVDEGASALVAMSGTARLPALLHRARASSDPGPRFLETARRLAVDAPVYAHAYAHPRLDLARLLDGAAGLAGVVVSASR